ncbi:MAG: hypothetical protein JXJ20_07540 [Anaerolineae bacterium]|nr:hypothetical protein [Anaerolineae bacterium]
MSTSPQIHTLLEQEAPGYADRSRILRVIGGAILLLGITAAFLGPLEVQAFYLFIEGGRFHYEGFRFGSFVFAYIAAQTVGYYAIAAVCIPLGYAHLRLQRWAGAAMLTLLWFWMVAGLPLTAILYLMFLTSKATSVAEVVLTLPLTVVLYPVLPWLLIRFYQGHAVQQTFARSDPVPAWLERIPLRVRVVCIILMLYIVALYSLVLVNGVFPWFGVMLTGTTGILALDAATLVLAGLIWGLARQYAPAWWLALIDFGLLTLSTLITFSRYTYREMLEAMALPPHEMEWFQDIPFIDWYPAPVVIGPLLVTLACLLVIRPYFSDARVPAHPA